MCVRYDYVQRCEDTVSAKLRFENEIYHYYYVYHRTRVLWLLLLTYGPDGILELKAR